jgi:hypothetical protein
MLAADGQQARADTGSQPACLRCRADGHPDAGAGRSLARLG